MRGHECKELHTLLKNVQLPFKLSASLESHGKPL
jgi:hypothetical protein